jgi:hypothetical protein
MKRDAIREERVLSLFTVTTPLEELRPPVPALTCGQRTGKTSILSSAWTDFGAFATEIWKGKFHVLSHICLSTHYNQRIFEGILVNFNIESFAAVFQNMLVFVYIYINIYCTEISWSTCGVTKLFLQPIYNIITSCIHVGKSKDISFVYVTRQSVIEHRKSDTRLCGRVRYY